MTLFPYEKVRFQTKMGKRQVLFQLRECTIPHLPIITLQETRLRFHGYVDDNGFNISPVLMFSPSVPAIIGTVKDEGNYRVIDITIRPRISIVVIPILFFSLFSVLIYATAGNSLSGNEFMFLSLPFLVIYIVIVAGFNYQARKCKVFLAELIETSQPVN